MPQIRILLVVLALLFAAQVPAAEPTQLDVPAGDLTTALELLAKQSGAELVYQSEQLKGLRTKGVTGKLSIEEALSRLLEGTALTVRRDTSGAMLIAAPRNKVETTDAESEGSGPDPGDDSIREVIVTGTRIRAAADQFAPVRQVDRRDMDLAGHATVGDMIDDLPQNFGGGVSLDTIFAGNSDGPGAVAINLRGLGNGATLTLLNGRRLAPGGGNGGFVDISSIPTSAISRVEVMTDGASAIYGSDAIAGVVNIVLREDFQGAESRVGASTLSGAGESYSLGQTLGFTRERAHGLLTYEYARDNELDTGDRSWSSGVASPTWFLPETERHSLFASVGAKPTDSVRLSLDAYYNDRSTDSYQSNAGAPMFERFNGVEVEQIGGAAGVSADLWDGWEATLSAAYSTSHQLADLIRLEVPMGAPNNSTDAQTEIYSADASLGGPLFSMDGRSVRGVVGAHWREESADFLNTNTTSGAINFDVENSRNVKAAFAEVYAPLLSGSGNRSEADVLATSLAIRYEDYSDVGSSLDYRAGLNWSPVEGFVLRGTYGTSFRAPRLDQLRDVVSLAVLSIYVDPESPSGESVALLVNGNTSDIDPEEADTWTAGFDFRPAAIPGLNLRATYFNIEYDGRVGIPDFEFDAQFRISNFTGEPVRGVDGATVQSVIDDALTYLDFTFGSASVDDITVLIPQFPQNLSLSEVSGIDLDVTYDVPVSAGDLRFYLNSSYLTSFRRQVTPTVAVENLRNTFSNPVDLRLRGGLQFSAAAYTAALAVNFTDGYTDNFAVATDGDIDSWLTVDASFSLQLDKLVKSGWAGDSDLTLSVSNLLDEHPPIVELVPLRFFPYDPANSDPAGRRISLYWTMRW